MFRIMHVNEADFSDRHWQRLYDMLGVLRDKYGTTLSAVTWQELRDRQLSFIEKEECCSWMAIFDGENVIGWMLHHVLHRGTTNESAFLFAELVDTYISPDLVTSMARELARLMDECGCPKTHTTAELEHMCPVFGRLGAQQLSKFDTFELLRENVNRPVIKAWLEQVPRRNTDLKLLFFPEPPEEYIDDLAVLLTETLGEMPEERNAGTPFHVSPDDMRRQVKWRRENKSASPLILLVDENNSPVAVSNVTLSLTNPIDVYQAMTGVRKDYRKRGLAKWLKAAMFVELEKRYPGFEKLTTNMRAINKPIQRINSQLGFQIVHEGFEYQLRREHLEKYLAEVVQ